MSVTTAISSRHRTYVKGSPLSADLRQLIIDKLISSGAVKETNFVPRGVLSIVAKDLQLHQTTVKNIWTLFCTTGALDVQKCIRGPQRKLSDEDVDYIRLLVELKPTLYKKEIRQLLLENTNSTFTDVSLSLVKNTVRTRLGPKQFTIKRTQRSNKRQWSHTNVIYMRNFIRFIQDIDPFSVRFVDEASVNQSNSSRYYGASEWGTRAVDISEHKQGQNYTIFCLIGLRDKCFVQVDPAPTGGNEFINFIHQARIARNRNGEEIIPDHTTILSDCASVHSGFVQTVLKPYLDQFNIRYYFIPKFSPTFNPVEEYISLLKKKLKDSEFQTLADYHVPTAVLSAAESIGPNTVYKYFRNVSLNYMNL